MSHEVNAYPSPEEQALVMEQLYRILAHQVKSYQASGRMRASSSIRTELAQELLGSVLCTLEQAGGILAWKDLQAGLNAGRKRLREQWNAASKKLLLVESSLPGWAEECRMEVLQQLRHFLQSYDLLHLAHLKADTGCFPLVYWISFGLKIKSWPRSRTKPFSIFKISSASLTEAYVKTSAHSCL